MFGEKLLSHQSWGFFPFPPAGWQNLLEESWWFGFLLCVRVCNSGLRVLSNHSNLCIFWWILYIVLTILYIFEDPSPNTLLSKMAIPWISVTRNALNTRWESQGLERVLDQSREWFLSLCLSLANLHQQNYIINYKILCHVRTLYLES